MSDSPYKMKGFSGFGNSSPAKDAGHAGSSEKQHHLTDEQKKKARYVELSKEHEDKPGFNEARDKAFGGKTTVKDGVSTTRTTA